MPHPDVPGLRAVPSFIALCAPLLRPQLGLASGRGGVGPRARALQQGPDELVGGGERLTVAAAQRRDELAALERPQNSRRACSDRRSPGAVAQ